MTGNGRKRSLVNSEARAAERRASAAPRGFMIATAAALLALAAPRSVPAATAEGVLITNVATGTFSAVDLTPLAATYASTANVLVANPAIQVNKNATPTIGCAGQTVTFCIWIANASAYTSAFNVIVEDKFGSELGYLAGQSYWFGTTAGATILFGWRGPGGLDPYCWSNISIAPCLSQGEPGTGTVGPYYVRWAVNVIGPGRSAMVCWRAIIQ